MNFFKPVKKKKKNYTQTFINIYIFPGAQTETTMFLEKEAVFPCHNWSIKIARIIWFGSISVDIGPAYVNNWQRFSRLCF